MTTFSRRNFITLSARGVSAAPFLDAGLVMSNPENVKKPALEQEQPKFRFLQINDIHVQSDIVRYARNSTKGVAATYNGANNRASWLVESLKNGLFPGLDFVLSIGDMIHGQNLEAIKYDMEFFHRHFYLNFPIPFYPAMGNHENAQREGDTAYEEPYVQVFGKERINYSFVHKGIHFIVVNNSGTWSTDDQTVLQARLTGLKKMLNEKSDLPKVICCHIPLIPVRTEGVLAKSFGFKSYCTKEQELVDLIAQHKGKILAVLSGHLHLSGVVNLDSVYHISLSGLASYPHDMGLFSVYENRIDVELIRVPSDMLAPETNIHGAKRFGQDFTDALHPDYTSYIMGNFSERRFSIPC